MSQSAGAWVTPEQVAVIQPTETQMLFRFTAATTDQQVNAGLAEVTTQLPAGSLTAAQSYLTLKRAFSDKADSYFPLLALFGVLGLLVSVLIVGNVVSGAVVSGYRHIGVLKALGFTPNQVLAVYLTMVSVPAVVGCVLGTLIGTMLAQPLLAVAFSGVQAASADIGVSPWVSVVCLLGMPSLVALAAGSPPCEHVACPRPGQSPRAARRAPGAGSGFSAGWPAPDCRARSASGSANRRHRSRTTRKVRRRDERRHPDRHPQPNSEVEHVSEPEQE